MAVAIFDTMGVGGAIRKQTPTRLNDVYGTLTGPSSYVVGGVTLPAVPNNRFLKGVDVIATNTAGAPYTPRVNNQTNKLMYYGAGAAGSPQLLVYAESDIKGSSATDVPIASGTLPTNGALVSSLANAAVTTPYTIAAQPDIPRTIGIALKNTVAGASTGNATAIVIVGTFRGAAQTETISFTALELTSTAQNEVAFKYGVKPFDSVTSITPDVAQPASWQHAAGISSKIGLPQTPANNAETDIIKLTKNGANLSPTGLYSTNQTVNFGTLADGDDVSVEYNVAGSGEVIAGFDLSGVTHTCWASGLMA